MAQYQSGTQTRRVTALAQSVAEPEAQLHPDLARSLDVSAGDLVELTLAPRAPPPSAPTSIPASGRTPSSSPSTGAARPPPTP